MALKPDRQWVNVETLEAVIACSPILLRRRWVHAARRPQVSPRRFPLPAGFDSVDAAILEWIAIEGRRGGRDLVRN